MERGEDRLGGGGGGAIMNPSETRAQKCINSPIIRTKSGFRRVVFTPTAT